MATASEKSETTQAKAEILDLSATELVAAYGRKDLSPVDVTAAALDRAEALNPSINAFYIIDREQALESARASEKRWSTGENMGLLDGVPVSVKDSVAVAGMPMPRGTAAYRGRPAPQADAPPVARMREAGAVILGKTTMPDLGLLGAGVSSAYGVTRNPWNLAFNTGGSTSGGAAAVAARIGPLTIGTDLGGSVRLPASLCGLSTIKPTQGLIPHLPPSATRSAGPIARNVEDMARFLTVLAGPDPMDYGSLPPSEVQYHLGLDADMRGWKVGVMGSIGGNDTLEPAVAEGLAAAARKFEAAGAEVTPIPRVIDFDFIEDLRIIYGSKGLAEVSGLSEDLRNLMYPVVSKTIAAAEGLSALQFLKASDAIEVAKKKLIAATYPFDVVIAPTSPVVNFPAEDVGPVPDDFCSFIHFTSLFNQTGQPAAVTCGGFDARGLPFGIQFIGRRFADQKVLQAAAFFERARGFEINWPEVAATDT